MNKLLLSLLCCLLVSSCLSGQTLPPKDTQVLWVRILSDKIIKRGDTLTVQVNNLSSVDRGFIVEAAASGKAPDYVNTVYSAFFNDDKSFFKKLHAMQRQSRQQHVPYILPSYKLNYHSIAAYATTVLKYIFRGKALSKGVQLKLHIETDIMQDKASITYSEQLTIMIAPD